MENFAHILLFKTNIRTSGDRASIASTLDGHTAIEQWHIDQEDEDCVLRVISRELKHRYVKDLVQGRGYECTELT
jgi:chaperone required for assembly of F1-ATPase